MPEEKSAIEKIEQGLAALKSKVNTLSSSIYTFSGTTKPGDVYSIPAINTMMQTEQNKLQALYSKIWKKGNTGEPILSNANLTACSTEFDNVFTKMDSITLIQDKNMHTVEIPSNYHNAATTSVMIDHTNLGYSTSTELKANHTVSLSAGILETAKSIDAVYLDYQASTIAFNTSTQQLQITQGITANTSTSLFGVGVPESEIEIDSSSNSALISWGYNNNDRTITLQTLGMQEYEIDWNSSQWYWTITPGYSRQGHTLRPSEMIPATIISCDTAAHNATVTHGLVSSDQVIEKQNIGIFAATFTPVESEHLLQISSGFINDPVTISHTELGYTVSTPTFDLSAHTATIDPGVIKNTTLITLSDIGIPSPSAPGAHSLTTNTEYVASGVGYIYPEFRIRCESGLTGQSYLVLNGASYDFSILNSILDEMSQVTGHTIIPIIVKPGDRFRLVASNIIATFTCDSGVVS